MMSERRFEFTDAKAHKFWSISLAGSSHTVQFGRIGTAGQTQTKEFSIAAEAQRSYEKLIDEKLRKGYVEVTEGNGSTSAPASSPATGTAGSTTSIHSATATQKSEQETTAGDPDGPAGHASCEADAPDRVPDLSDAAVDIQSVAEPLSETLEITRIIRLDPSDWFRATWRGLTPLPRPEPAPFHRQEALGRLLAIPTPVYGARKDWSKAQISPSLSREEAHFWFAAMTVFPGSTREIATRIGQEPLMGEVSLEDARQAIGLAHPAITAEIMLPLANLFSLAELVELMLNPDRFPPSKSLHHIRTGSPVADLILCFRNHLLPYLTDA
jgi:predicted DNA-binding WGR domain protein